MIKRLGGFALLMMAVVLAVIGLSAAAPLVSPAAQSTLVPLPPTTDTELNPEDNVILDKLESLNNRDITEFNVVYFISSDRSTDQSVLSENVMASEIGAKIAYSWKEVLDFDKDRSIQIVILDNFVSNLVDKEWIRNSYRRGVVIAVLDPDFSWLSEVLGDNCIPSDASPELEGHSLFIYTYAVAAVNDTDLPKINAAELGLCDDGKSIQDKTAMYILSTSKMQWSLDTMDDYVGLDKALVAAASLVDSVRIQLAANAQ